MIKIELTNDDAMFLGEQLASHRRHVENELVHTDVRTMQSELAHDLERIERLHERLTHAIAEAAPE